MNEYINEYIEWAKQEDKDINSDFLFLQKLST